MMVSASFPESLRAPGRVIEGGGAGLAPAIVSLGEPLDLALPWRGLPCRALHEVSGLAATDAVAAMARRCLRRGGGGVGCRAPRPGGARGAPTLARFGLGTGRLTVVQALGEAEIAAALEAALRCDGVACAVAEIARLDLPTSRRLQRAAMAGDGVGLVLRPEAPDFLPSAALTRWRAEPVTSPHGILWRLTLWHARGGAPGVWTVRWDERRLAFVPAKAAQDTRPADMPHLAEPATID